MGAVDNRPLFSDGAGAVPVEPAHRENAPPWKIAVVDDDRDVHTVTQLVLADYRFKGRPVKLLSAYTAQEARPLLQDPEIAVVLLDVVMESERAGLELVKYIRENLGNDLVRIILRTGQPGQAPEGQVISEFDINDYKEKSELTAQRLVTAVTAALRGYNDLISIRDLTASKETLERVVSERTAELTASNQVLRHHQDLLAEAQKIANIGNYEWNLPKQEMTWSDQVLRILGLPPGTDASMEVLLQLVPQEELAYVQACFTSALDGDDSFNFEHSIRRPDGTLIHVHQQGEVQMLPEAKGKRLVGTVQDITERYRSEEAMRKLSTAIEQTADSVMITDRGGVIEYVNAAFTKMTGYLSSEVLGQTPRILRSGQISEVFYRRMWRSIRNGEVFSDVFNNRRKDGTLYYEAQTISPQKDSRGRVTHFISTGRDMTEQILIQEKIQHLAHHDALTGLPNRILLNDRLEQAMARAKWHKRCVAVLFMDMDRFKVINDTLGHTLGDQLLKELAVRLTGCVREGDTVARMGGDEFAVVLNDMASREDVGVLAKALLDAVRLPFQVEGRELFITTSIGISLYPLDGNDSQTLLKRADVAMYNAKVKGKHNYVFYTERDEASELARLSLETGLRRALDRREFFLLYQPIVDAASYQVRGFEALLRWRRSDGEVVPPGEFIGLLEETGMIQQVGDWVLNQACAEMQAMRASSARHAFIAVNISLHQFRQPGFVDCVFNALRVSGLPPEALELELTESLLVDDVEEVSGILLRLKALGVRLVIDDFGTGYSSMHYLRRLPFDVLKIDKSFVDGLPDNKDSTAIVTAILTLANSMELEVVAEGVESLEQLEFLQAKQCSLVQGYLLSRPVRLDDATGFIRQERIDVPGRH